MRLNNLRIEGFRRIKDTMFSFGQATFLIGENNVGKSSTLTAIELLLSARDKLEESDYSMLFSTDNDKNELVVNKVVLTGEFYNVNPEITKFHGFNKSRLIKYKLNDETKDETGLKLVFRKSYEFGKKVEFSLLAYPKSKKIEFEECKKPQEFIDKGIDRDLIIDLFGDDKLNSNIPNTKLNLLDEIDSIWNIDDSKEEWDNNPGGIIGNIVNKLPKFILIPAQYSSAEIDDKNGALHEILNELFREVREASENYKLAHEYLGKLAKELNPADTKSEFGKMMGDLNNVLDSVFPLSKLYAEADLSDPEKALKPSFNIEMSSNIKTQVSYQGTGMVRSVVFSLLKYRETWRQNRQKTEYKRSLIIGFEEPEIYLHPNATAQMRDTIYNLASANTQIICSTHSPYMIDLSRKPKQVLNNLSIVDDFIKATAFNISKNFKELQDDDRTYIKMLQKVDDHVARVFFAKKVIVVEGDTDEIILKRTIDLLSEDNKKRALSDIQIIKARGKATIISLVKYLTSLEIKVFVIHDRDGNTEGAVKFNEPILEAVGDEENRLMMEECIEDELGYSPPSGDKPVTAYKFSEAWNNWNDMPIKWRTKMEKLLSKYRS